MGSLLLKLLTLTISVLFIFLGHIKVTGDYFPEYHHRMRNEFGKFNKEFPLYHQTGWRPYAKNYRLAMGYIEIACGCLLLTGILSMFANIVLIFLMTNGIMTLQKLNYSIEYTISLIFISFLLAIRLVLVSREKSVRLKKKSS